MKLFSKNNKKGPNDRKVVSSVPVRVNTGYNEEYIYVENQLFPEINDYVKHNFQKIYNKFRRNRSVLRYLPRSYRNYREVIAYFYPDIDITRYDNLIENINDEAIFNYFNDKLKASNISNDSCGFIAFINSEIRFSKFIFYSFIPDLSQQDIPLQFENFVNRLTERRKSSVKLCIDFSTDDSLCMDEIRESPVIYVAEEDFDTEAFKLIREIELKVEKLNEMGYGLLALQKLLLLPFDVKISRLIITKRHEILLPDYNEMRIKMAPLTKAVFLLFLKYPDGIMFKDLPDYGEELLEIYSKLTNRDDIIASRKSIELLTDPFNNSINEKCSRIREAFVSSFHENIACHYYITGNWNMPKKIKIDRSLVFWE